MNRFPRVMAVRLGYDPEQVDDFVRRIERTLGLGPLDGPPVTADEIRNAKFAVRLGGYNETAVDFALDAFIVAVEARAGQQAASPPGSAPEDVDGRPGNGPRPAGAVQAGHSAAVTGASAGAEHNGATVTGVPAGAAQTPAAPGPAAAAHVAPAPQTAVPPDASPAPGGPEPPGPARAPEPVTASWLETQAARAERVAFRPGRLGMGYREDEVDEFLDRVVATLRGTAAEPLTAEQVRKATFATVVFRPGYAINEVDGFLAEMASVLERRS